MDSKEIISELSYEQRRHTLYRPYPKPKYRRTRSSPRSGRVRHIPVALYLEEQKKGGSNAT